jgi:hypothetical protein
VRHSGCITPILRKYFDNGGKVHLSLIRCGEWLNRFECVNQGHQPGRPLWFRTLYNIHVVGLNAVSILVISTLAAAALGLISIQAAFLAGGVLWMARREMMTLVQAYEFPPAACEDFIWNYLERPELLEGRDHGFPEEEAGELTGGAQIARNGGVRRALNWEPVSLRVGGEPVWLRCLPDRLDPYRN